MKIDRLVGILSVLLQKDKTTAAELSEKFEVSRRTSSETSKRFVPREYRSLPSKARAAVFR